MNWHYLIPLLLVSLFRNKCIASNITKPYADVHLMIGILSVVLTPINITEKMKYVEEVVSKTIEFLYPFVAEDQVHIAAYSYYHNPSDEGLLVHYDLNYEKTLHQFLQAFPADFLGIYNCIHVREPLVEVTKKKGRQHVPKIIIIITATGEVAGWEVLSEGTVQEIRKSDTNIVTYNTSPVLDSSRLIYLLVPLNQYIHHHGGRNPDLFMENLKSLIMKTFNNCQVSSNVSGCAIRSDICQYETKYYIQVEPDLPHGKPCPNNSFTECDENCCMGNAICEHGTFRGTFEPTTALKTTTTLAATTSALASTPGSATTPESVTTTTIATTLYDTLDPATMPGSTTITTIQGSTPTTHKTTTQRRVKHR